MKLVFVSQDPINAQIWEPVANVAADRGLEVVITNDSKEPGDIGFYCEDLAVPGNQQYTIVSINGLDQDHVLRPTYLPYFKKENWNLFDIGLLPGDRWADGFCSASAAGFSGPKLGVLNVGWPKSDCLFNNGIDPAKARLECTKPHRVLYAPQTEQDGKQTQVVDAVFQLGIDLSVKHWETIDHIPAYSWLLTPQYFQNLENENAYLKTVLPSARLFDPKDKIMNAFEDVHLLITDQSSVLYEAALLGIPTLTISGWRHACGYCLGPQPSPDITLSVPFGALAQGIERVFANYPQYVRRALRVRSHNFVNLGSAAERLLDSVFQLIAKGQSMAQVLPQTHALTSLFLSSDKYIFDQTRRVFFRKDFSGIDYSDGEQTETTLKNIIQSATDVSSCSSELEQFCVNWPNTYHLSQLRGNILRPLKDLLKSADVLEVGAGCGAVTRYLGEVGARVLALEGSQRRAEIARLRTRDLENVEVVAEDFMSLTVERKFDVVTLIGVLEYSAVFVDSAFPVLDMLRHALSFLKPGGKLIIAIENQLGLKYFAGAPEDHLGKLMYGIENLYTGRQPQTFGLKQLKNMIMLAGFSESRAYAPIPDYKLPRAVVTDLGANDTTFDAAAFAIQNVYKDPQLPENPIFKPERVWRTIFENGLGIDLANSFLLVAGDNLDSINSNILAFQYSTYRKPEFMLEKRFVKNENETTVMPSFVYASHKDTSSPLTVNVNDESYASGINFFEHFLDVVTRPEWKLQDLLALFTTYSNVLKGIVGNFGISSNDLFLNTKIPGDFFDAIPSNLIISGQTFNLVDREWSFNTEIPAGYVLFRAILQFALTARPRPPANGGTMSRHQFIIMTMNHLGFQSAEQLLPRYLELEMMLQELVSGKAITSDSYFSLSSRFW